MRRHALAVVAVVFLGLVACGAGDNPGDSNRGTITTASEEKSGEEGSSLELNEPFEISTLDNNDVFLKINEITLGEDCKFGAYVPDLRNDVLGGENQYLQILAEVDVQKLSNPMSKGIVYLDNPKIVDDEGFVKNADLAKDCQSGGEYENWMVPTSAGDKSRRYAAYVVPKDVTEVRVHGKVFAVK